MEEVPSSLVPTFRAMVLKLGHLAISGGKTGGMLLTSGGERPEVLLNILQ